jgi:hypothetical protein
MKPPTNTQCRRLIEEVDELCGRYNDGLAAVAIVLAIIMSLLGALRSAQTLRVPEGFEIVGTT